MKTYKTQEEVEKDIVNGVLSIEDNVTFECDISIKADINANDIKARSIDAYDILAYNIDANDIDANDIKAYNINANDIIYYAFCNVYNNIKCKSIKARRAINAKPVCLDGELTIKNTHTIKIDDKEIELSEESFNDLKEQLNK
tara:strand:- start:248 stop:676 length:429 start_codon:yes stop_codon:yes gene_type:complete